MGILQNFQKFRVRVWRCYRTHRSSGYCGTGVQNSLEVPSGYKKCCTRTPGFCVTGRTELTEIPDTGMNILQNVQKFRVRVWKSYRNFKSSGYCDTVVQTLQKFRVWVWMSYRTHRSSLYGLGCYTELTEVPGTGNTRVNTRPHRVCINFIRPSWNGWNGTSLFVIVRSIPTCFQVFVSIPTTKRKSWNSCELSAIGNILDCQSI